LINLSDAAEREAYNAAERNERKQHTKEKVLLSQLARHTSYIEDDTL